MSRRSIKVVLAFLVVFLAGAVAGDWMAKQRRESWRDPQKRQQRMLETFSKKLDLTPEQRQQVAKILEDGQLRMRSLHDQVRPQFEALRTETSKQIRAVLTPEQATQFNTIEAEFATRRERYRNRWGGEDK